MEEMSKVLAEEKDFPPSSGLPIEGQGKGGEQSTPE